LNFDRAVGVVVMQPLVINRLHRHCLVATFTTTPHAYTAFMIKRGQVSNRPVASLSDDDGGSNVTVISGLPDTSSSTTTSNGSMAATLLPTSSTYAGGIEGSGVGSARRRALVSRSMAYNAKRIMIDLLFKRYHILIGIITVLALATYMLPSLMAFLSSLTTPAADTDSKATDTRAPKIDLLGHSWQGCTWHADTSILQRQHYQHHQ
jgi:hypothetical protein